MEIFVSVIVVIFLLFKLFAEGVRHLYAEPGKVFENRINRRLQRFEKDGGRVLQNCFFRWRNGSTVQIDNLLIYRSGIYVIECKDYKGWVFGNDINDEWTVSYYGGRYNNSEKHSFYNPIKQNQGHIRFINSRTIGMNVPIHNLVVFSNDCTLKNITNNTDAYIINEDILYQTIRNIDLCVGDVLSQTRINELYYRFQNYNVADSLVEEEHVRNVYNAKSIKKRKTIKDCNCPICDGYLVLREGRYGQFYGCSNYPDCSFTKRIDE